MERVNRVYFGDIFSYARDVAGIGWNEANDLFAKRLHFGSTKDFYSGDLAGELHYDLKGDWIDWQNTRPFFDEIKNLTKDEILKFPDDKLVDVILLRFMIEWEVDEMEIDWR